MARHERFLAWQQAHQLTLEVYKVSRRWPSEERFGVTSQARRAAASVAANIAEGAAREGRREFRRFLNIALGSLGELDYHLRLARDLEMLDETSHMQLVVIATQAGKLLMGLKKSMEETT